MFSRIAFFMVWIWNILYVGSCFECFYFSILYWFEGSNHLEVNFDYHNYIIGDVVFWVGNIQYMLTYLNTKFLFDGLFRTLETFKWYRLTGGSPSLGVDFEHSLSHTTRGSLFLLCVCGWRRDTSRPALLPDTMPWMSLGFCVPYANRTCCLLVLRIQTHFLGFQYYCSQFHGQLHS